MEAYINYPNKSCITILNSDSSRFIIIFRRLNYIGRAFTCVLSYGWAMDQNSAVTLSVVLAQSSLGSIPMMMSCWVFLPGIPSLSWPRLGLPLERVLKFFTPCPIRRVQRAPHHYHHTKLALKKEKVFNPKIVTNFGEKKIG